MAEAKDNVTKWERLREWVARTHSQLQAKIDNDPGTLNDEYGEEWMLGQVEEEMDRLDAEAKAEGKAVKDV